MKKTLTILCGLAVVAGVSAGVVAVRHGQSYRVGMSTGATLLPSDSVLDWTTYGDHLVLATAGDQIESAPTEEEMAAGEGFIDRAVTFTVDQVMWSRGGAPAAPKEWKVAIDGYEFTVKDGKAVKKRQIITKDQPLIRKGKQYAVLITYIPQGRFSRAGAWTVLGANTILPYEGGVIGEGDSVPGYHGDSPDTTARNLVWKKSEVELIELLESTPPDPASMPYLDLPPVERYRATMKAKRGGRESEPFEGEPR